MSGILLARGSGGWVLKKDSSSSCKIARSMPGAIAITLASSFSPDWLACTCTWLACSTTWALVRMRLPSMTTPVPEESRGDCLDQGLKGSGEREVEKIFTTAFSTGVVSVASAAHKTAGSAAKEVRIRRNTRVRVRIRAMKISINPPEVASGFLHGRAACAAARGYLHSFYRGARRIAPSRRITSPLSMSFSKMCTASLA